MTWPDDDSLMSVISMGVIFERQRVSIQRVVYWDSPINTQISRAGHNFRCPLISPLSVDPLVNGTALILHFENVNLTEERLVLSLLKASTLKIRICRIF